MDQITENIYIGNYRDASDMEMLKENDIKSILALNGESNGEKAQEAGIIDTLEIFDFIDGSGNDFRLYLDAVDTLKNLQEDFSNVLVHCHAGRSRSAVVVAGYLVQEKMYLPEDALDYIRKRRNIKVAKGLLTLLYKLY